MESDQTHPATPADRSSSASTIRVECRPNSRFVMAGQESFLKLLACIAAPSGAAARPRLNVCLAVDRSFSMQDDHKLQRAQEAACAFIDLLKPEDIFSLVEFGADVRVTVEARSGASKDALKNAVYEMKAHGATNLYDALHAAGATVHRSFDPARINRVILLSDGVPTDGITAESEILGVARSARYLGIGFTTIGLGEDYDEILLSRMSEITGANHYYVEHPGDIPRILAREFNRMEALVARDLKLRIVPMEGATLSLLNNRFRSRSHVEGRALVVELDDLERGGVQPLLCGLAMPALSVGAQPAASFTLQYPDPQSADGSRVALSAEVMVNATDDAGLIRQGIDRDVLRAWEELDAIQSVADAVDRSRIGDVSAEEVASLARERATMLARSGSGKAAMLERLGRTIHEQGTVSSEVAKRTVVERVAAQRGQEN